MPYDDLDDDPGDQALDELDATLSGERQDDEPDGEPIENDYDPESEPAFMTDKSKTQHTVYSLPDVWDDIDGSAGLLFDAEVELRRGGVENIQKRELYNALFAKAVEQLDGDDLAEAVKSYREQRKKEALL